MKKKLLCVLMLMLGLFLLVGCGNQNETLKAVLKELNSLKTYTLYKDNGYDFKEKINGNTLNISFKNEYAEGSYDFVLDNDGFITLTSDPNDIYGSILFLSVADAVAAKNGMDEDLLTPYIQAVSLGEIESEYVKYDDSVDRTYNTMSIYAKEKFDISDIKKVKLTDDDLEMYGLEEGETSFNVAGSKGTVIYYVYGNSDEATFEIAEHDALGENALDALKLLVAFYYGKAAKEFTSDYNKIEEKKIGNFEAKFMTDKEEISEHFSAFNIDHYKFLKVTYKK